jgi:hypothetical protein
MGVTFRMCRSSSELEALLRVWRIWAYSERTQNNYMQRILNRALQAVACLALLITLNTTAQAAPADGTWTWTTPGRNGGPDRTSTLKLMTEGDKVTGTISGMGRQNQPAADIKITDGKVTGDEISFKVSREGRNGNTMVQKYTGKVSGDSIKGKVSFTNQNGEEQSRDWEAKKKTEEKK